MLPDKVNQMLDYELEHIGENLEAFRVLFKKVEFGEPDLVEKTALASVLHSFYMGVEKVFIVIAKSIDSRFPKSESYHKELLVQMSSPGKNRPALITPDLANDLLKYLKFRHYFRNSYEYILDWNELKPLIQPLESTWERFRKEISLFQTR